MVHPHAWGRGTSVARASRVISAGPLSTSRSLLVAALACLAVAGHVAAIACSPASDPKPEPNAPLPNVDRKSPEPGSPPTAPLSDGG